jgi:hypothetical protein
MVDMKRFSIVEADLAAPLIALHDFQPPALPAWVAQFLLILAYRGALSPFVCHDLLQKNVLL